MADTSTDSLTCSVAGETADSAQTIATSQSTFNRVVSSSNAVSFNTGRYNADPIIGTDSNAIYSIQAIYSFNSNALIVEATV